MADSNNLGIGVMIGVLANDGTSGLALDSAIGKVISKIELDDGSDPQVLRFVFSDGWKIKMWDSGQSCCEARYMTTDDNLDDYIGATLLGAEIKDVPGHEDEYGEVHEIQFLDIKTSRGVFQMVNHNEHNGYYGGFCLEIATE